MRAAPMRWIRSWWWSGGRLTVALLDRIAEPIRARLGFAAEDFPLAKVLEGGTWATGRTIGQGAARRRLAPAQRHQRRNGVLDESA